METGLFNINTTKALMLVTVAVLTPGTGTAVADRADTPNDYWSAKNPAIMSRQAANLRVQAGSSDLGAQATMCCASAASMAILTYGTF
jgi:hypothetical protein